MSIGSGRTDARKIGWDRRSARSDSFVVAFLFAERAAVRTHVGGVSVSRQTRRLSPSPTRYTEKIPKPLIPPIARSRVATLPTRNRVEARTESFRQLGLAPPFSLPSRPQPLPQGTDTGHLVTLRLAICRRHSNLPSPHVGQRSAPVRYTLAARSLGEPSGATWRHRSARYRELTRRRWRPSRPDGPNRRPTGTTTPDTSRSN